MLDLVTELGKLLDNVYLHNVSIDATIMQLQNLIEREREKAYTEGVEAMRLKITQIMK